MLALAITLVLLHQIELPWLFFSLGGGGGDEGTILYVPKCARQIWSVEVVARLSRRVCVCLFI